MAGERKLLASGLAQAFATLVIALFCAWHEYLWIFRTHLIQYNNENPHDGQNGLGAWFDALMYGFLVFAGVIALSWLVRYSAKQRKRLDQISN